MTDEADAPRHDNADTEPRRAGRQLVWPTLWHRAQLAFPWGSATRLRRRPERVGATDDKRAEDAA